MTTVNRKRLYLNTLLKSVSNGAASHSITVELSLHCHSGETFPLYHYYSRYFTESFAEMQQNPCRATMWCLTGSCPEAWKLTPPPAAPSSRAMLSTGFPVVLARMKVVKVKGHLFSFEKKVSIKSPVPLLSLSPDKGMRNSLGEIISWVTRLPHCPVTRAPSLLRLCQLPRISPCVNIVKPLCTNQGKCFITAAGLSDIYCWQEQENIEKYQS